MFAWKQQNQQHNVQQGRRKIPPKKIIPPAPTQEVKVIVLLAEQK